MVFHCLWIRCVKISQQISLWQYNYFSEGLLAQGVSRRLLHKSLNCYKLGKTEEMETFVSWCFLSGKSWNSNVVSHCNPYTELKSRLWNAESHVSKTHMLSFWKPAVVSLVNSATIQKKKVNSEDTGLELVRSLQLSLAVTRKSISTKCDLSIQKVSFPKKIQCVEENFLVQNSWSLQYQHPFLNEKKKKIEDQ